MRNRPISLLFILSAIFLTGCTNNTHTIRTLNVSTPANLQAAIYIDSQYVGSTPLHMQVDQDTIEGAELRIVIEGKEIKNYTLHKDIEIENETGKTAIALGTIGTGTAMIFTPLPAASRRTAYIPRPESPRRSKSHQKRIRPPARPPPAPHWP